VVAARKPDRAHATQGPGQIREFGDQDGGLGKAAGGQNVARGETGRSFAAEILDLANTAQHARHGHGIAGGIGDLDAQLGFAGDADDRRGIGQGQGHDWLRGFCGCSPGAVAVEGGFAMLGGIGSNANEEKQNTEDTDVSQRTRRTF
jgi:hypothetical protein